MPRLAGNFFTTGVNRVAPDTAADNTALVSAQLAHEVDTAAQPAQETPGPQAAQVLSDLFTRLAKFSGEKVVHKVLACITLCKEGISEVELVHLLSLDDDVLAEQYEPPVPVIVCSVVTHLLAELQPYLVRRGASMVFGWKNSQLWEAAEAWLFGEDGDELRERVHADIADYLSGKYHGVRKAYPPALREVVEEHVGETAGDRLVPAQRAVLSGKVFDLQSSAAVLNERRLAEYVHHCIGGGLQEEARAELTSIFYIAYKFRAGMGPDVPLELAGAAQRFPELKQATEQVTTFIDTFISLCRAPEVPWALLQAAFNEPDASLVRTSLFEPGTLSFKPDCGDFAAHCVTWLNRRPTFDPCQRTVLEASEVKCLAYAIDGARVAYGCADCRIKVVSVSTGDVLRCLTGHSDQVTSVSWGPDGQLASGSWDKTVKIWDANSGTEQYSLTGHEGFVKSVSWGPNGELASGSLDKTVRVWDANSGTEKGVLSGHTEVVTSVAWGANGELASGSWDKTVRVWDATSGTEQCCLAGHTDRVNSVSWGPDGQLASGSSDKTVRTWDATSATEQCSLAGHEGVVTSVSWGARGELASGSEDKTARVWDANSGTERCTLAGHTGAVTSVSWGSPGQIFSGSKDQTMKFWDVSRGTHSSLAGHSIWVTCVSWGPNGELASGSKDKVVRIWDANSGTAKCSLAGHTQWVTCLSWGPDGQLASGSSDKTVRIWDANSGTQQCCLTGHEGGVTCVSWGPDGQIASGSNDKTVRVWDATSGTAKWSLAGHTGVVTSVAWGANGELASGSWDKTVRIWDATSGTEQCCLTGHKGWVTCVSWGPHGELASGSWDNTAKIWFRNAGDYQQAKKPAVFSRMFCCWGRRCFVDQARCTLTRSGHSGFVSCVSWGPSGELASSPHDTATRIWDANSGAEKRLVKGHAFCFLLSAVATADGRMIRVYKLDGTQVVCVMAPSVVTAISCEGVRITAGCKSGEVLHLEAAFLRCM